MKEAEQFIEQLVKELAKQEKAFYQEQSEMSAAFDYYTSMNVRDREATTYDFEHERDRGHTWDIGEDEVELPPIDKYEQSARKTVEDYKDSIYRAFEQNFDDDELWKFFGHIEGNMYCTPSEVEVMLNNTKYGVIPDLYEREVCSIDKEKFYGAGYTLKNYTFIYDEKKKTVLYTACDYPSSINIKIGENIEEPQEFIANYDKNKLNEIANKYTLESYIDLEKENRMFCNDIDYDDWDKAKKEIVIFDEAEMKLFESGYSLEPLDFRWAVNNIHQAKEKRFSYNKKTYCEEINDFKAKVVENNGKNYLYEPYGKDVTQTMNRNRKNSR